MAGCVVAAMCALSLVAPSFAAEDELAPLIAGLDERGLAALQQSLSGSNMALMASEGSANHALWSAFAQRGWMIETSGPGGGPVGVVLKVYTLTPDGLAKIPAALDQAGKP